MFSKQEAFKFSEILCFFSKNTEFILLLSTKNKNRIFLCFHEWILYVVRVGLFQHACISKFKNRIEVEFEGKEDPRDMKTIATISAKRLVVLIPTLFTLVCLGSAFGADTIEEVEKIIGVKGQMQEGATVFSFPRSDIKVTINGDSVPTGIGFGSWTAWKAVKNQFMIMGDLVLLEKEINPVISALAEANINVTGLHNHFIGEEPRIMYSHVGAMGPPEVIAKGLRNALDKTATPRMPSSGTPPALALDTKRLEEIIGHPGKEAGGVYKITLGRSGVKMQGVELTASMGLNTWAAFAGTNEKAHVAGDVAMTAAEVNKVIRELRKGGINLAAVHNHMLDERPRIFFLHYWGTGPAEQLAKTVRSAFDQAKGPVK